MAPTLSPTAAPTLPAHYEEVTSGNCISTGRLVPTEAECELVAQKMGLSDQDVSGYAGTAIASGCVFYKRSSLYMNHKQWTGNQPCSTISPCLCRTADWTAAAYVMTTVPSSCTEPIANADECEAASAILGNWDKTASGRNLRSYAYGCLASSQGTLYWNSRNSGKAVGSGGVRSVCRTASHNGK